MPWLYLLIASLLEVTWAVGLKQTGNWSKLLPSAVVIAAYLLGFVFLSLAVRDIPASIAYSVWVGLGIVGVAGLDIFFYGEAVSAAKLVCIALILIGTVGLKVLSPA